MKSGIPTFPLENVLNDKMNLLEAEFGTNGFAVMIKLFQYIYSKGYYTQWDIDVGRLFTKERCPDVGWQLVSEIVACGIRRGIFDKDMYAEHKILTSDRIQETYLTATKRRKEVELDTRYLLPIAHNFIRNVDNSGIYVYKNSKNVCKIKQSKVKESKVKKSVCKADEVVKVLPGVTVDKPPTHTLEEYKKVAKERVHSRVIKAFKKISLIDKHMPRILNGEYRDFKKENSFLQSENKSSESENEESYSADELNAWFEKMTYEDI